MATGTMQSSPARSGPALWLLAAIAAVFGLASVWAGITGAGGLLVGVVVAVAGTILVVRYPFLGIVIFLTTFLVTYPSALRGVGNLTINNGLGMILVPMLLYGTLREGVGWFTKLRPLLWLIMAGVILITAGTLYNREIRVEGLETVELRRGAERELYGARAQTAGALVQTRDRRVKYFTRLAFVVFFVFFVRTPQQLKVVVGVLLSVLLLTYLNVGSEAGQLGWGEGRLRVTGSGGTALYTGTNPNKLAFYALFCLTLLWYMRERIKSWVGYIPWFVSVTGAIIAIPYTASRSGFLNLLLFSVIVLLEGRFSYRKVAGVTLVAALAVIQFGYNVNFLDVVLPSDVSGRLTQLAPVGAELLPEGQEARGSFQKRIRTLHNAFDMLSIHPLLGVGLGNYPLVRVAVSPTAAPGPPHNSYLWAATEAGLIGLGLYLASFFWIMRQLTDILREYEGRFGPVDMRWLVHAMRTTIIVFMFFSFFADVWAHIFFYVIIGMSLSLIRLHRTYTETGHVPGADIGGTVLIPGGAP
ncbi:MAG: O-antigen ligase [Candidatus Binatia bacterium]|jgi:O-antigen ligase